MAATIEQMLQQQINIIQDLSRSMKEVIESCEYFQDQNEELQMKVETYEEEFEVMKERIVALEGQNFKLRKTIWRLKSDFNCTCEEVGRHSCDANKI